MSKRGFAKHKKVDATTDLNIDKLTITETATLSSASVGSGFNSSLTYQLGTASSFSTVQARFGTRSLHLPRSSSSGLTIEGLSASSFGAAWTIEFWWYPLTVGGFSSTVMTSTQNSGSYVTISQINNGSLVFSLQSDGTDFTLLNAGVPTSNTWNHVSIGYNGTDRYFCSLNGTYTQTLSATILNWTLIETRFHFGSSWLTALSSTVPTFTVPCSGFLDEIRFSSTQRYTANFTPSTSAFTSDGNTFLLHHCESLLNSQEAPALSATSAFTTDSSGNVVITGDLSSATGNISLTTGDIQTSRGSVLSYRDFKSTHPAWRIGSSSILGSSSAFSATTTMGCYTVSGSWTSLNASSHTIRAEWFLLNPTNDNVMVSFTIYVSDKANGGSKLGIIRADYFLSAASVNFYLTTINKIPTLITLTATNSGTSVVVTSDSNCRMCWRADVAI